MKQSINLVLQELSCDFLYSASSLPASSGFSPICFFSSFPSLPFLGSPKLCQLDQTNFFMQCLYQKILNVHFIDALCELIFLKFLMLCNRDPIVILPFKLILCFSVLSVCSCFLVNFGSSVRQRVQGVQDIKYLQKIKIWCYFT